jgi:dGTPase
VVEGYREVDVQRWAVEPPKNPNRGAFARDRARVLHSSALRRLAAKTQVVGPTTDDFVRNRLTHSLEVAQVGRELGGTLGCDPDVVDTACLSHDLGHPPFGHNGEDALAAWAHDIGGFEGNAQTLRVLTRLEPKVFDLWQGFGAGLNLTRASLDACTKYPWSRGGAPSGFSPGKFGVYDDDLAVFGWLREPAADGPAHGTVRCLEAQVMDLADDVAYSVHDVEDAVVGGHFDPRRLTDPEAAAAVVDRAQKAYLPDAEPAALAAALARLQAVPVWVGGFDGSRRAMAAVKDLTSRLIGRFVAAAHDATRARYGPGRLTRYGADLVVPGGTAHEIAVLKAVASVYVMTTERRRPLYQQQRDLLTELVEAVLKRSPDVLEPVLLEDWRAAEQVAADPDRARRRVAVDQVASLTDARAVAWHRELCG